MKKYFVVLMTLFLMIMSVVPTAALEEIELYSKYAYVYDIEEGTIFIDEGATERIYPASMTKILTAALMLEKVEDLDEKVQVTQADINATLATGASVAGFNPYENVTYRDILYGMLLPSGADACYVASRATYGSAQAMVTAMNEKIEELGLTQTHFANVTGLHDNDHYTTAFDMGKILEYALKNEEFKKAFCTLKYTDSYSREWLSSLERGKELKGIDVSSVSGGKSGYTGEAQLTFASLMEIEGHDIIAVTAKAEGQYSQHHVADAVAISEYLNKNYHNFTFIEKDEVLHSYFMWNSLSLYNKYKAKDEVKILISNDYKDEDIEIKKDAKTFISAPLSKGDSLGVIQMVSNDKVIATYNILSEKNYSANYLIIIGVVIIIGGVVLKPKKKKSTR